jgi:hypothetical protein
VPTKNPAMEAGLIANIFQVKAMGSVKQALTDLSVHL